jgi:hypothetical protein
MHIKKYKANKLHKNVLILPLQFVLTLIYLWFIVLVHGVDGSDRNEFCLYHILHRIWSVRE